MKSISVVIAARNEADYIGRCIDSVIRQEGASALEIIVVNNASSDQTAAIAKSHGCVVIDEKIPSQVLAKQVGCISAKGEIIAVIDADCVVGINWLKSILEIFSADPAISAVTGPYQYKDKLPLWAVLYNRLIHSSVLSFASALDFLNFPYVIGGNVAFRRDCFISCGGYRLSRSFAETEIGISLRLRRYGKIKISREICVTTSGRRFYSGLIDFFVLYKMHNYFWLFFFDRVKK